MTSNTIAEPEVGDDQVATVTQDGDAPQHATRRRRTIGWRWIALSAAAALIAGGAFGVVKFRSVSAELAALRQTETDRAAAAGLARDYALKALTYSFEDPEAFFAAVQDGVSQTLKDKYSNAAGLLKALIRTAQITSTGEILAADPVAQPGNAYQVVVSATHVTRNLQNPEPRTSLIVLQVTVNKVGDSWQVSDIGPRNGARPADSDPLMPATPGGQPAPATNPSSSSPESTTAHR